MDLGPDGVGGGGVLTVYHRGVNNEHVWLMTFKKSSEKTVKSTLTSNHRNTKKQSRYTFSTHVCTASS